MSKLDSEDFGSSTLWVRAYSEQRLELENQRLAALRARKHCRQSRSLIRRIKQEVDASTDLCALKETVQNLLDDDYARSTRTHYHYETEQE